MDLYEKKIEEFLKYNIYEKKNFGTHPLCYEDGDIVQLTPEKITAFAKSWSFMIRFLLSIDQLQYLKFEYDAMNDDERNDINGLLGKLSYMAKKLIQYNNEPTFDAKLSVKPSIQKKKTTEPSVYIPFNDLKIIDHTSEEVNGQDFISFIGYEIIDVLNKGADGVVFDVIKKSTNQHFALKVLIAKFYTEASNYVRLYNTINAVHGKLRQYLIDVYEIHRFPDYSSISSLFPDSMNKGYASIFSQFNRDYSAVLHTRGGVIIMEKMDGSLGSSFMDYFCDDEKMEAKLERFFQEVQEAAVEVRFQHDDLHANNVAFKFIDDSKKEVKFKLIDLARSTLNGNEEQIDKEWETIEKDFNHALAQDYFVCRGFFFNGLSYFDSKNIVFVLTYGKNLTFAKTFYAGLLVPSNSDNDMNNFLILRKTPLGNFLLKYSKVYHFNEITAEEATNIDFSEFLTGKIDVHNADNPEEIIKYKEDKSNNSIYFSGGFLMTDAYESDFNPYRNPHWIPGLRAMAIFSRNMQLQEAFLHWLENAKLAAIESKFKHNALSPSSICITIVSIVQSIIRFSIKDFSNGKFYNETTDDLTSFISSIANEWDALKTVLIENIRRELYHHPPNPFRTFHFRKRNNDRPQMLYYLRMNECYYNDYQGIRRKFYFGDIFDTKGATYIKENEKYELECVRVRDKNSHITNGLITQSFLAGDIELEYFDHEMVKEAATKTKNFSALKWLEGKEYDIMLKNIEFVVKYINFLSEYDHLEN